MSLKNVFIRSARTVFKVFASLTHPAVYVSYTDTGFEDPIIREYPIDMIMDTFSERDVQFLSFSALIQPTDIKGLVRGEQLLNVEVATTDKVRVDTVDYHVIAYSTDPARAVFTLLLRNV
jgi:hypothetical protein